MGKLRAKAPPSVYLRGCNYDNGMDASLCWSVVTTRPVSRIMKPDGGAIAIGHPPGMSGTRIAGSAALELIEMAAGLRFAAMCICSGQGIACAVERG